MTQDRFKGPWKRDGQTGIILDAHDIKELISCITTTMDKYGDDPLQERLRNQLYHVLKTVYDIDQYSVYD